MRTLHFILALLAVALAAVISIQFGLVPGLVLLTVLACLLNRPQARLCTVTLSVPEILKDVLDAFTLDIPRFDWFTTDFSTDTAVLGDKGTAKISHVPVIGTYDGNNGGFYNASQDVTTLIEDVPCWLNQMPIITIKLGWLTQLSSKVELYKEATRNIAYALRKQIFNSILASANVNFSNSMTLAPQLVNADTVDGPIRSQLNFQKIFDTGRYMICGTPFAQALGADDRIRSKLFWAELNDSKGYRSWKDVGGFENIVEYPDLPTVAGGVLAMCFDKRAGVIVSRRIKDASDVARQLGVKPSMLFEQQTDPVSGLPITACSFQEAGTGDVYAALGCLVGTASGNQGGVPGSITDNAGLIIRSA